MEPDYRDLLLRYLLGEMSAEECEQVDARLLSDEYFGEQITEAKFDLLSDYASGRLGAEDRARVEKSILAGPMKSGPLQFTLALSSLRERGQKERPTPQPARRRWRPRLAVAISVVCLAVIILGVLYWRLSARRPAAVQEMASATPAETPRRVLLLGADVTRGVNVAHVFQIPESLRAIEVQIVLNAGQTGSAFAVTVKDEKGRLIASRSGLAPVVLFSRRIIQIAFPARMLPDGRYAFQVMTSQGRLAASYLVDIRRETHAQPEGAAPPAAPE